MRRPLRAGIATATALATGACQTYTRVPRAELAPGGDVRVELTDRGAQALTYQLGPRVAVIEGHVRERDSASVLVSVTQVTRVGAQQEESWPGDTVRLTDDATASAQLRRLSRGRSFVLAGALIAGAALVAGIGGIGNGVGGGSGGVSSGSK